MKSKTLINSSRNTHTNIHTLSLKYDKHIKTIYYYIQCCTAYIQCTIYTYITLLYLIFYFYELNITSYDVKRNTNKNLYVEQKKQQPTTKIAHICTKNEQQQQQQKKSHRKYK